MQLIGIVCEYNPFHMGHKRQMDAIRASTQGDCGIVCLMSGYFVQRGHPAVFPPLARAEAAILSGADLVLELPVNASLSSAEGFAAGSVAILGSFCHKLCFGTETMDAPMLMRTAEALLSPEYRDALREALKTGCSFPAAREAALSKLGTLPVTSLPNDILGVEYCKAILAQNSSMQPLPIHREGDYHASEPAQDNPSATALRNRILAGEPWLSYVPEAARAPLANAPAHLLSAGERAILGRLRTMTDEEFAALPYGSEGLWRKLMHESRRQPNLEAILTQTKSKRYTRSRLDRMVMCAFLGLDQAALTTPATYARVLAFNDRGRSILNTARNHTTLCNAGQRMDSPWQQIEDRCGDLYGLFCRHETEAPGAAARQRVIYCR